MDKVKDKDLLDEFRFKVMDHSIIAAQTFLGTFLKISTVYLTLIGIFFAVANSELAADKVINGFRFSLFMFTIAMLFFGILFHFLVHKSFKYYFLMAEDLGAAEYLPGIARGRRMILLVGRVLLFALVCALVFFTGILIDSWG